jgi:hypothetical protein
MVYNLEGISAYSTIVRYYLFGFWRGRSLDDCLWNRSDGHLARHYTKDMLADVLRPFFSVSFGQDADAIPLPHRIRRFVTRLIPTEQLARYANARGLFLFATATK